ncbi:hypothetical protein [Flavobacterium xinjiangense]|uniref:Uncharacterized protein n=1 Tax=Flavobacterium xinjiangense TaxID=178356 RepID=A0A1M7FNN8_9FLAO|nr:hypothetical protein [Flavobacterium xinjiangense]SHM05378.1 hypothetical protein SAMN05216269_102207 [Flavobacterium xinjiangense]
MTEKLKNQLQEIQKEKDHEYRLKQLKALRNEIILLILNKETKHDEEVQNRFSELLDPKSICKN